MIGKLARSLAVAVAIGAGWSCAGGAAEPPIDIGVVGATGGTLTIATVEPDFDWPILVRRNDGQAGAKAFRIESSLLVGPGGKTHPLRLRKDNADFAGDLSLEPNGQTQLQLTGSLPDHGDYTGELRFAIDGKVQPVTVKIARGTREIVVVGAAASGLVLNTPDAALDWLITVRRNDNASGARPLDIAVSGLVGPSGRAQEVKLRRGNADFDGHARLDPLSQIQLRLIGELPEVGDYGGELGIVVDGKRQAVALTVKRALKDSPIRIEEVSQARATLGAATSLRVRLQETEGQPFRVSRPKFMRLDVKDGTAQVQAKYDSVKVLMPDKSEAPETITVGMNQLLELEMVVTGLDRPGAYSGVVRVTAEARKLVDKAFEIGLRRDVCTAVGVILFGVLLSTLLRGWISYGRPAVVLRESAASAREKLVAFRNSERGLNDEENRIIAQLNDGLDALTSPGAAQSATAVEIKLDEIRRKIALLPDWVSLRRKLDAVRPVEVGAGVRGEHKKAGELLAREGASQADTDAMAKNLRDWSGNLEDAIRDYLTKAIKEFREEIDKLPEAQRNELDADYEQLGNVQADVTSKSFDGAVLALQHARRTYAQVVIKAMQDMLAAAQKPPGFADPDWVKLKQTLSEQLARAAAEADEGRQIEIWNKARLQWLRAVSQGLARRIVEMLNRTKDDQAKASLEQARNELSSIETKLKANQIADAQAAYEKAVELFEAARSHDTQLSVAGAATAVASGGVGAGVPDALSMSGWWNAVGIILGGAVSAKSIGWRLFWADAVLAVVLAFVAVVVGLNLLYFDKPTWGSDTDILVAILWGFGLHTIGGSGFQGLQGLAGQIVGVKG